MQRWLALASMFLLAGCGSGTLDPVDGDASAGPEDSGAPAPDVGGPEDLGGPEDTGTTDASDEDAGAEDARIPTGPPVVETVVNGVIRPWAIEFMPDGRAFVTERGGSLRILGTDDELGDPISGVPSVYARGQGGLLDVHVSPDFEREPWVYLCYAASDDTGASGTELARARLENDALSGLEVLFRVNPKVRGGSNHYGCRISFSGSGHLFLGVGDRFGFLDQAQELGTHLGKVIRLNPDGTVPADNPYVGQNGVLPEIWSYGHRNIQGMATHPETGEVWTHEHGPRGGDEVNIPRPAQNFGWPLACYGDHYDGRVIPDEHAGRGFTEPVHFWNPSIAPSGMTFYDGDLFPEWRGQLFVGALAFTHLARLELDGERVIDEARLLSDRSQRIRDVTVSPDGAIYVVTDANAGQILRITRR